jgi:hypothetical protein
MVDLVFKNIMSKELIILTLVVLFTKVSVAQKISNYEIKGTALGIVDNTVLYLEFTDEGTRVFDSTLVTKSKFSFSGQLKSTAVHALIKTKNYSDYKFFWLENSAILFEAEKGKFRQAIIKGSITQDKQNELDLLTASINHKKRIDR